MVADGGPERRDRAGRLPSRFVTRPKLAPLISAIGMSFVLQNVGIVCGGANQRTIDSLFPTNNLLEPFGITESSISTVSRSSSAWSPSRCCSR